MPFEWIPLPKTVDGRRVDPEETLGKRPFDPADPQSVKLLREEYDRIQAELPPPPRIGWFKQALEFFGMALAHEHPNIADLRKSWGKPFEEVLAEVAASEEPVLLGEWDKAHFKELPILAELPSMPHFPVSYLDPNGNGGDGVPGNDVMARTKLVDFLEIAAGPISEPLSPERMVEIADALGWALEDYDRPSEEDEGVSELIVSSAIDWLRFWAGHGHSCHSRTVIRTSHGIFVVEVG